MGDVAEMEKPDHPSSANVGMRWTGLGTRALISFCASHIHEVKMSGNQPKEALWRNAMEYVRRHSDMHDLESPLQCRRKWCALADKLRAEMKKSALPEKQSRWEYFELMRRAYLETPNTIRTLSPDASLPFENENPMAVVSQSTLPFDADPHDESAASRIDQETILHHPIDMETRAENPSQAESGVLSTSGKKRKRSRLTNVTSLMETVEELKGITRLHSENIQRIAKNLKDIAAEQERLLQSVNEANAKRTDVLEDQRRLIGCLAYLVRMNSDKFT